MASAGLKRRFEGDIEIRLKGGDVFHEVFQDRPHDISSIHPDFVQGCDLHHGAFGTPGSKICWSYTLDGKPQKAVQILEVVDEINKVIKFKMVEGDLMNDYDTFIITYQVISEGKDLSLVKWIFEYEKKHAGVPEPSSLMDALLGLAKEIDDHHHRDDK